MKANEKFNKCVRSYMTQTWSSTLYCHLKSTLKFHTNQPISGLIEHNTLSPNLKFTTSPSSKTAFAFSREVYRALLTGRTDIYNITLRARFKRNSGKEKLQRQTITKVRYFAGSNKLASRIQLSHSLSEALVLVSCDKFLLRIAFRGFGFPRNKCLSVRFFFALDPNLECVKVSSSTNLSKSF